MADSKIVGIGNALVDIIAVLDNVDIISKIGLAVGGMTLVDGQLSATIQSEIKGQQTKLATGGSVANAINAVANLNVSSGFLGAIGNDELGKLFEQEMKEHGIDCLLNHNTLPTGRAVCLVAPDGERTMASYLGAAVEMGSDDVTPEKLAGYDIFFIEGYLAFNHALILAAASVAKTAGLTIALDLASYTVIEANREVLNELVDNYVDIVFANEEEAISFTGLRPEAALCNLASRCDIAVVKVGKEGAFVRQGNRQYHIPSMGKLVIDTTGAGDFFAGGFLAGLAKGYDLEKCGRLGALLAGKIIGTVGASLSTEEWAQLRAEEQKL